MVYAHTTERVVDAILHDAGCRTHRLGDVGRQGGGDVVEAVHCAINGDKFDVLDHDLVEVGITGQDVDDRAIIASEGLVGDGECSEAIGVLTNLVVEHLMSLETFGELGYRHLGEFGKNEVELEGGVGQLAADAEGEHVVDVLGEGDGLVLVRSRSRVGILDIGSGHTFGNLAHENHGIGHGHFLVVVEVGEILVEGVSGLSDDELDDTHGSSASPP